MAPWPFMERFVHGKMGFLLIGDLALNVNGSRESIADDSWRAYLDFSERLVANSVPRRSLTLSPYCGPSAKQRQAMVASGVGRAMLQQSHAALLTGSALVRGAVTALGWVARADRIQQRAFRPEEAKKALIWLEASGPIDFAAVMPALSLLAEEAGLDPRDFNLLST